jgi:hypothetical protein
MEYILEDTLTLIFCGVIFIIFFTSALALYLKISVTSKEIIGVNNSLLTFKKKPEVVDDEVVEHKWLTTQGSIAFQNYKAVEQLILNAPSLKSQWRNYSRSMQVPHKDFEVSEEKTPTLRNTIPVEKLFSFSEVFDTLINVRFFTSIPNKLTGFGLLFTFIGLMMGISEASIGLSSGNIADAKDSLNPLLRGASIAFTTSIVGLFLSMIFSVLEKFQFHKLEIILAEFCDLINERIDFVDSDKFASMQLDATKRQTKALSEFQFDQKRITDETIIRVAEQFKESLTETAGKELTQLGEIISKVSESLEFNITKLNEQHLKQQESSQKTAIQFEQAFEKITITLKGSLDDMVEKERSRVVETSSHYEKMIQSVQDSSQATIGEFEQAFEKITITLKNSLEDMEEREGSRLVETSSTYERMIKSVQGSSQDTIHEFEQAFSKINTALTESLGNMEEREAVRVNQTTLSFEKMIESLQSQVKNNTEQMDTSFTRIQQGFEQQTKLNGDSLHELAYESANQLLSDLRLASQTSMQEFMETANKKLENIQDNMAKGIAESEGSLSELLTKIPQAVNSMVKVSEEVNMTYHKMHTAHNTLNDLFDNVGNVTSQLSQSISELSNVNSQAADSSRVYADIANVVKNMTEANENSAKNTESTAALLQNTINKQAIQVRGMEDSMQSLFNGIESGLKDYSMQTNDYMQSLDQYTAGISDNLVEAINELKLTVNDIKSVA